MTDEEIHKLSVEIRAALIPPRCVSTEIPAEVQAELKEKTWGRGGHYRLVMPIGSGVILINTTINNSGAINLELQDMNARPFWRVYLSAEGEEC